MGEGAVWGRGGFNPPTPIQVVGRREERIFRTNDLKNKINGNPSHSGANPPCWPWVPTKNLVDYLATGICDCLYTRKYICVDGQKALVVLRPSSAVVGGGGGGGVTRIAHAHAFGGARVGPSASVLAKQSVPSAPRAPVVPRPQNTTAGDRTGAIAGGRVRACACVPSRTRFSSP